MSKRKRNGLMLLCSIFIFFFSLMTYVYAKEEEIISGEGGGPGSSITGGGGTGTHKQRYGYAIKFCNAKTDKCTTYTYKAYSYYGDSDWKNGPSDWITATKISNGYKVTTNPEKLYKHLNIPYGEHADNYQKLKDIMKKKNISLSSGDYILIEPFTQIRGKFFTFRGIVSTTDKEGGWPFYENYKKAAMTLANAAQVGSDITVGGNTYTAPSGNCVSSNYNNNNSKNFCGYGYGNKGNKYIGYGMVVVSYDQINPPVQTSKLTIIKQANDDSGKNNVLFTLTGNGFSKSCTTSNGGCTIKDIPVNSDAYTLTEIVPRGYDSSKITCDGCSSATNNVFKVKIDSTTTKTVTITNQKTCVSDFNGLNEDGTPITIEERINLYANYKNTNGNNLNQLLNFGETAADKACEFVAPRTSVSSSCLKVDTNSNEDVFSNNNWSKYNDKIGVDFCYTTFSLKSEVGTNFSSDQSGKLLNEFGMNSKVMAKGTLTTVCYSKKSANNLFGDNTNALAKQIYETYINNFKFGRKNYLDIYEPEVSMTFADSDDCYNSYCARTRTIIANYNTLKKCVLKGTGQEINCQSCLTNKNCIQLGHGILSDLNSKDSEILPFSISIAYNSMSGGNKIWGGTHELYPSESSTTCNYTSTPKLITPGNEREIEFRIIDTENPFPGSTGLGRKIGSNWCDSDGFCSSKNKESNKISNLITNDIVNATNSNGYNKGENLQKNPKYVIELNSNTIGKIREYNKSHKYDDFTLVCDDNGNFCESKFLRNNPTIWNIYVDTGNNLNSNSLSGLRYNLKLPSETVKIT